MAEDISDEASAATASAMSVQGTSPLFPPTTTTATMDSSTTRDAVNVADADENEDPDDDDGDDSRDEEMFTKTAFMASTGVVQNHASITNNNQNNPQENSSPLSSRMNHTQSLDEFSSIAHAALPCAVEVSSIHGADDQYLEKRQLPQVEDEVRRLRQIVDNAVQAQTVIFDGDDEPYEDPDGRENTGNTKHQLQDGSRRFMGLNMTAAGMILLLVVASTIAIVAILIRKNDQTSSVNNDQGLGTPQTATMPAPVSSPILMPTLVPTIARPSSLLPSMVNMNLNRQIYCVDHPPTFAVTCEGLTNQSLLPPSLPLCFTELVGLKLLYRGGGCTSNQTSSRFISMEVPSHTSTCQDFGDGLDRPSIAGSRSFAVITDFQDRWTFFEGWVTVGDTISFDDQDQGFGLYQRVSIYASNATIAPDHLLQVVVYPTWDCWPDAVSNGTKYGSWVVTDRVVHNHTDMTIADMVNQFPPSTVAMLFQTNITNTANAKAPGLIQTLYAVTNFAGYLDLESLIAAEKNESFLAVGSSLVVPIASVTTDMDQAVRHTVLVYAEAATPEGVICHDSRHTSPTWSVPTPPGDTKKDPPSNFPTQFFDIVDDDDSGPCKLQVEIACEVTQLCGMYDPGVS